MDGNYICCENYGTSETESYSRHVGNQLASLAGWLAGKQNSAKFTNFKNYLPE